MVIARGLSVSHHWAITGTPTKNLLGSPHAFEEANTAKSNSAAVPEAGPSSDANEFVPEEDDTRSEKWSGDALDDLKKLGTMFGQYLQAKPFVVAGTDFAVVVERPLKKAGGPDYGAVQRVERLMQGMMIRNRYVTLAAFFQCSTLIVALDSPGLAILSKRFRFRLLRMLSSDLT